MIEVYTTLQKSHVLDWKIKSEAFLSYKYTWKNENVNVLESVCPDLYHYSFNKAENKILYCKQKATVKGHFEIYTSLSS